MKLILPVLALLALAACATTPTSTTPSGSGSIPSAAIEFGDFRRASPDSVARDFSRQISARYGQGQALNAVTADLARNNFSCQAGQGGDRGDPPDRLCRRNLRVEGCVHTWQVMAYGQARLDRIRTTYDRACGDDDLLGG